MQPTHQVNNDISLGSKRFLLLKFLLKSKNCFSAPISHTIGELTYMC